MLTRLLLVSVLFLGALNYHPAQAPATYPVCAQSPLPLPPDNTTFTYLPLIQSKGAIAGPAVASSLPPCTVYCGLALADDPYRPAGYHTYFADEFDCNQRLPYWTLQSQMTPASYTPPANGYTEVSDGTLKVGVTGPAASFPYLYLIDDRASTYDIPYQAGGRWANRVDWLPDLGDFRIAMRLRFPVERLGEHRIALYMDGHQPSYAGPLLYVGYDYNDQVEAWRGLIVGTDRANSFVDLGEHGYADPYTDWIVVTADFQYSQNRFSLAVDSQTVLTKPLSSFKGYPQAAIRPDILYLGSLALMQEPSLWTNIELDWLRVYAPETLDPPPYGLLAPTLEASPWPGDPATSYSAALPPGPFANTPYWSEDFNQAAMPGYWTRVLNPDPVNAWTEVKNGAVRLRNNGHATATPVWAIFDDLLPLTILSTQAESPLTYLNQRRESSLLFPDGLSSMAVYPRFNWRPNNGNVRYAWRGLQTANGYGVEISNGGHVPYFTGALFYTLQDTTSNNGGGQFIFPGCQEQYFWRLHQLPQYRVPHEQWVIITADYINGTAYLYVNGQLIGWWPESDCSLNWYLKGENATSPDTLFFGNLATGPAGSWSQVSVDWFATFAGLSRPEFLADK